MKFAASCLSAFCAFQTVYTAELPLDADTLSDKPVNALIDVVKKLASDIRAAGDSVQEKGLKPDEILNKCFSNKENDGVEKMYENSISQCFGCNDKAGKTSNDEADQNCCEKYIDALKKYAQTVLAKTKTCIEKCAKPVVDYQKMDKSAKTKSNFGFSSKDGLLQTT